MLQQKTYSVAALGRPGLISRENPIPQMQPAFVEDDNCVAGRFCFLGTQSNQVKGIAEASTEPEGIIVYDQLQLNVNGDNSMKINHGEVVKKLLRGCVYIFNDGLEPNYNDNVLVDPLTGLINCSSSTTQAATSGKLLFENVNDTYTEYTSITDGTLTIKVDGTEKALSSLDFSSATSMNDVAGVFTTALSSSATCTYTLGSGLTITSATSGSSSIVEFISISENLESLLGSSVSIDGTNAMVNSGWKVININKELQTIEVEKI